TLWNSVSFMAQYANTSDFTPSIADLTPTTSAGDPWPGMQALDRWLLARTARLIEDTTSGYEQYLTVNVLRAFESYLDDLSNWYIRRSRRRFWNSEDAALRTLWTGLVQSIRVIAPITPFLAEHMWQSLVVAVCPDAPASIFLAGWPEAGVVDDELVSSVAAVRKVVDLGRRARANVQIKTRQPLRTLVVEGAEGLDGHLEEIADELRVKQVIQERIETAGLRVKPNFRKVAPRLGASMPLVKAALDAGEFREIEGGRFSVLDFVLEPDDVFVERLEKAGWEVVGEDGLTVALDTTLDDELGREGRVYELIHQVNTKRKERGLGLSDRIVLSLPSSDADLLEYADWIKREVLAVSIDLAPIDQVTFEVA
ncbi:MAG: class I tRNA ligase family protein, partial [Streptosporangiaceae bacterium]